MKRPLLRLLGFIGVAVMLLAATMPAQAATISNLSGQSCGGFSGTWHFVNNQTGGAGQGMLSASWSTGETCNVLASKVNPSNQHFYCTASGMLLGASTNLPGRLVLSDFSCDTQEPPPCDPKTDPTCEPPPPPCDPKKQICK